MQTEIEALKTERAGGSSPRAELARLLDRKQALRLSLEQMEE